MFARGSWPNGRCVVHIWFYKETKLSKTKHAIIFPEIWKYLLICIYLWGHACVRRVGIKCAQIHPGNLGYKQSTEEFVRKKCSWSAKHLQESVLKQQLLTDQLKSNKIVYGLQPWCTKEFELVYCKSCLLRLKKGKWREKLMSKWKLRFTPNHTHLCWHDWEAGQLLNKSSWQIQVSSKCICPHQNLFICVWSTIMCTKTMVMGCIDVHS